MPQIPSGIEELRRAPSAIDPAREYRLEMPDGSILRTSGEELLETASAAVALADADRSGDRDGIRSALARLGLDPAPRSRRTPAPADRKRRRRR